MTSSLLSDLRLALRLSTKHLTLKIAVILTLALGLGANAAMFTVLSALLFTRLPYPAAHELVGFQTVLKDGGRLDVTSYPAFQDWAKLTRSFDGVAATSTQGVILSGEGEAEPLTAEFVSADYFSVLGLNPIQGRTFTRDETAVAGSSSNAIISAGLWRRRFGGDPTAIGRNVRLNEHLFTIIGVLTPGARGLSQKAEVWIPITMIGTVSTPQLLENRVATWVSIVARLKPGVSLQAARQEVSVLSEPISRDLQSTGVVQIAPLESRNLQRYGNAAWILFGAVIFVLLIACLNVANLLLSYFSDRRSELAVRHALGAPRFRLLQQLLLESLVLAAFGGGLGLLLAFAAVAWLGSSIGSVMPGVGPLMIDARVFLFSAAMSLLAGTIAGLLPLIQVLTRGLSENLRNQARIGTSFSRARLRTALVISQISFAVVLVVGAALMLRSMQKLKGVDPGFNADHVLIARLSPLPAQTYDSKEKVSHFYDAVLDKLSRLPQLRAVSVISSVPLVSPSPSIPFLIRGRSDLSPNHPPTLQYVVVSRDYFSAMSIPLLQGRWFNAGDSAISPPVAIVNEAMARQLFPGTSPLGQYLNIFDGGDSPRQIVGVAGNVRDSSVDKASVPEAYLLYQQVPPGFISILRSFPLAVVARTAGEPQALAASIRSMVRELESDEAVLETSSMQSILYESVAEPRLYANVLFLFALIALGLAALGIYGVVSYSVSQRTQELGVRMALGAGRERIMMLVLGRGIMVTLAGVGLGLAGAWALSRLLHSMLFDITPSDPLTFLLAAVVLCLAAVAAAYIPARRASRVDPSAALREK